MKKITAIISTLIIFMLLVSYILVRGNTSIAASPSTVYKDWSDINMLEADYSYSTLFYSENTEVKIVKNTGKATWNEPDANRYIRTPIIDLDDGDEVILLVTNCAVDKNGKLSDVVVKVNKVNWWGNVEKDLVIRISMGPIRYNNSQLNPTPGTHDYERKVEEGEVIKFSLEAAYSDCIFTMKYYLAGTYKYNNSTGAESGTPANISSVNNFIYDLDVVSKNDSEDYFLGGREGLKPMVGNSEIYYNKNNYRPNNKYAKLVEIDGGIACQDREVNTNGVWYQTSAFVATKDITNSSYSFRYGGTSCRYWILFYVTISL